MGLDGDPRQALIQSELGALVAARTGVDLARGGLDATFAEFVRKRAAARGQSPADYARAVLAGEGDEERILLESISVPHTWFFRDRAQVELALSRARSRLDAPRTLRIWIPGCATGEDPYGIAVLSALLGLEVSVLGTDLSASALSHAKRARYGNSSFRELSEDVAPYFVSDGPWRTPVPEIRRRVSFEWHNLMDPARVAAGGWDLIVCRNVVIYFSRSAALSVVERLGESLAPDGALVLGAGELSTESPRGLEPRLFGPRVLWVRGGRAPTRPGPEAASRPLTEAIPRSPAGTAARAKPAAPRNQPSPVPRTVTPNFRPSASLEDDPFRILLEAVDLQTASSRLEALATAYPGAAAILLCTGIIHFTRGDYERALDELGRARAADANLWPTALYAGLCLERLGEAPAAKAEFLQAQSLLSTSSAWKNQLPVHFSALAAELLQLALDR